MNFAYERRDDTSSRRPIWTRESRQLSFRPSASRGYRVFHLRPVASGCQDAASIKRNAAATPPVAARFRNFIKATYSRDYTSRLSLARLAAAECVRVNRTYLKQTKTRYGYSEMAFVRVSTEIDRYFEGEKEASLRERLYRTVCGGKGLSLSLFSFSRKIAVC